MLQLEHEKTLVEIEVSKTKIAEAEAKLADAKRGREDEDGERPKTLARLGELKKMKETMEVELGKLKENDPQALANLEKELKLVTEAANRWTDNVFSVSNSLMVFVTLFVSSILVHYLKLIESTIPLISSQCSQKCKSYLTKKRGITNKEAWKLLGVSSEFDYPE